MKILACNCGSTSFKSQLIETGEDFAAAGRERCLFRFAVDNIGTGESRVRFAAGNGASTDRRIPIKGHQEAVAQAVETMLQSDQPVIRTGSDIDGVGHRVVHGGEEFTASTLIDEAVESKIEEMAVLAPLHNPENLRGIRAARAILPRAPQVAVFDTSFHQTLPRRAFLYALPQSLYRDLNIRRYGFHGTSFRYIAARYAALTGKRLEETRIIACHLGNGTSICAISGGRSVDVSMGMTPLEGLVMGTRGGDVDPGVLLHLLRDRGWSVKQVDDLLNRQSGLAGLSGVSNDARAVMRAADAGDAAARMALDVFCYRAKKYIGAYSAVMNGCDALLFTGGIGEHRPPIREWICGGLDSLGIILDLSANAAAEGMESRIGAPDSRVDIWVIPTNEELMIARDTERCIARARVDSAAGQVVCRRLKVAPKRPSGYPFAPQTVSFGNGGSCETLGPVRNMQQQILARFEARCLSCMRFPPTNTSRPDQVKCGLRV